MEKTVKQTLLAVTSAIALAGAATAGDAFQNVEYISGKAGFEKKVKGQLAIDEVAVAFSDPKGKLLFSIPMAEIDKVSAGTEQESGSFGRKLALGIFASKTEEYLQIASRNASGAEGVVFKVKKKTGAGMAAKIDFWAAKARTPAAEPPPAPADPLPPLE